MKGNTMCAFNVWALFREEYIRDPMVSVLTWLALIELIRLMALSEHGITCT